MFNPNFPTQSLDARLTKLTSGLALSTLLLVGCSEPAPSHNVTVKQGQSLDDIGSAECGPSFLGMSIAARRNHIRDFNDLDTDKVTPGQVLKIPDSLCYDTGDKVRDGQPQP